MGRRAHSSKPDTDVLNVPTMVPPYAHDSQAGPKPCRRAMFVATATRMRLGAKMRVTVPSSLGSHGGAHVRQSYSREPVHPSRTRGSLRDQGCDNQHWY